jgi:hypothetical protein
MAERAFYLTVIFITVFIFLFIYNLIRCYNRSPSNDRPIESKGYSRELQNTSAVEDDALDLNIV